MDNPSAFYDLFDEAQSFTLGFPAADLAGPYWDNDGKMIRQPGDESVREGIEAVQLGPDHFRLAYRSDGPFSSLRLRWGDEFIATPRADGALTLIRVLTPQPYAHYRFFTSGGFGNDAPAAMLVHEMDGGWESVAGGILTLTVPAARSGEFAKRMAASGVKPGALTMVD